MKKDKCEDCGETDSTKHLVTWHLGLFGCGEAKRNVEKNTTKNTREQIPVHHFGASTPPARKEGKSALRRTRGIPAESRRKATWNGIFQRAAQGAINEELA